MSNPYSAYKKQSVSTMTPVEVVIKLYSETERQLAIGVSAIESKDIKKAHESLMKAQELLGALRGSLDMDIPISNNLDQLYDFFQRSAANANLNKDAEHAEELKKIMPRAKWCDTLICVPACNIQTAAKAFKDLRISVITTKRAYDELEADGFLYTVAGKGCFVAEKNLDLIREQKLKELEDHLDAAVELAAQCGVSALELMEMLRILLKEEEPHV